MGAVDRWLALSSRERSAIARVAPTAALAIVVVRLLGIRRALRWAAPPVGASVGVAPQATDNIVTAVTRASRYMPGATCLSRSAAAARLLRKKGVAANVRIGVETDPAFAAHAWVEVGAMPLTGSPARYMPLPPLARRDSA